MHIFFRSTIGLSLLSVAGVAYACSCMVSTPAEYYTRADVVFSGTVKGVAQGENGMNSYAFSADMSWKGSANADITVFSHESSATCGVNMEKGVRYVVFANINESGDLTTTLCSGTAKYDDSDKTLEYLATLAGDECRPYMCADGSTHPRCTADGHMINYFADPCHGKGEAFADVAVKHPQYEAIAYVKREGVVEGYADGTFKPGNTINRAEFAKMIATQIQSPVLIDSCLDNFGMKFPDVSVSSWYAKYVCTLFGMNVVQGYPDGTYGPGNSITVAEAAKIIVEAYDLPVKTDPLVLEAWWQTYIRVLSNREALPASYVNPEQRVTRGDLAEILWKLDTAK